MQQVSTALQTALEGDVLVPKTKVILTLSNNANKNPAITAPSDTAKQSIIDGFATPSMKFAYGDTGQTLNDGVRLYPSKDYGPQIPWVGPYESDAGGLFSQSVTLTVEYPLDINANKILVVSDPFGTNDAGRISLMDIYILRAGTWTRIAQNFNPNSYRAELYLQSNTNPLLWSPIVNRANLTTIGGVRVVVKKIVVDTTLTSTIRPRRPVIYEIDSQIEADVSDYVEQWAISKTRDISDINLNPIGLSSAGTLNITFNNTDNRFNNDSSSSPYYGLLSTNAKIEIQDGFRLADLSYEYIPHGIYYSDEWTVENNTASVSVTCRDRSKFLQENEMSPFLYQNYLMHEIIQDVVERGGIKDYEIDTSVLTSDDLSTGATLEIIGLDEVQSIKNSNMVWSTPGQTFWSFLQTVAASDLGNFYFDESGIFHYKTKEYFTDVNSDDAQPVMSINEDNHLITATSKTELVKNSIDMNYTIPELSKSTVGLWEAENPTILSSTSLANAVDSFSTVFDVGDQEIDDWPKEGYFKIDNEIVKYNYRTTSAFTECERGQLGTSPAAHYPSATYNWDYTKHIWTEEGGLLKVTGKVNNWGYALSKRDFKQYLTYTGKFKITASPWRASVLAKVGAGGTTYYKFVMRTVGEIGDNDQGVQNSEYFLLYRVRNNVEELLAKGKNYKILTNAWHTFKVVVDEQDLELSVDGVRVISFTDKKTGAIVDDRGKIGLGAIGDGPTYFDDIVVTTNNEKEEIVFQDHFGKPIYEVRKWDAEYSVQPAKSINYFLTNDETAEVVYFKPGPFSTEIAVQNKLDDLNIIEGSRTEKILEGLVEFFILYGYAIETTNQQTLERDSKESIRKYGKQEASITLPWVQSRTHAKFLADFLIQTYKNPVQFINATVFDIPHLQLGDVVSLTYDRMGIVDAPFHVTAISVSADSNGRDMQLTLRKSGFPTLVPSVGGESCPAALPPNTFYVGSDDESSYNPKMEYPGYSETIYDTSNSPVTSIGSKVPFRLWRPATKSGQVSGGGIMLPSNSNNAISRRAFPTIIWAHGKFPRNSGEFSDYAQIKWLQKIVRQGFNVAFVDYRGSGGWGQDWFNLNDPLHDDLTDLDAVRDYVVAQAWCRSNKVTVAGFGYGGTMALYSGLAYPSSYTGIISISGSPCIECSIQRWPDNQDINVVKQRIYKAFGGTPLEVPSAYTTISPLVNYSSITADTLMLHGELDSLSSVRDTYAFHNLMVAGGKEIQSYVYPNASQGFVWTDDGYDANLKFQSDPWTQISEWLAKTQLC